MLNNVLQGILRKSKSLLNSVPKGDKIVRNFLANKTHADPYSLETSQSGKKMRTYNFANFAPQKENLGRPLEEKFLKLPHRNTLA